MIIGNNIIYLKETTSTMDVCKKLASNKFKEGVVVIANYQNSGRGRFNRVWISPQASTYTYRFYYHLLLMK